MDGVDAILADVSENAIAAVAAAHINYPPALLAQLHQLCEVGPNELNRMGQVDRAVGEVFANAINKLLTEQQLMPADILAIGSHGQTIRHYPDGPPAQASGPGFTLQIGDPHTIAALTGIDVVADFRRKDIAFGGQGAPLVPAFHAARFAKPNKSRVIVNIGGFANITVLHGTDYNSIRGFDTGPGNALLDTWCQKHHHQAYDNEGNWAATGSINQPLLTAMLSDPYFSIGGPKSTGREYFNLTWLNRHLHALPDISPVDVQATLLALTAQTIADSILSLDNIQQCYICGGGAFNKALMQAITSRLPDISVSGTESLGLHPQWVEGVAFAWLAWAHLHRVPGNVPSVTGAERAVILGSFIPAG